MNEPGLARRYAQALFDLAKEREVVDLIDDQYEGVLGILEENRPLLEFLGTPRVSPEKKQDLVKSVFADRLEPALLQFLLLIRRRGRFGLVREIAREYHKLVMLDRNATGAMVTTAVALSADERRNLQSVLQKRTGQSVELHEKVDPSIIGGVVVQMGGHVYDDSIRHHLQQLRDDLRKVPVYTSSDDASGHATA